MISLEEHLPGVLCPAGVFGSVPGPLAPLDLRRQCQLQLLLRHHAPVQRGAGTVLGRASRSRSTHAPPSLVTAFVSRFRSDPAGVGLFLRLLEERASPHLRLVSEEEGRLRGHADPQVRFTLTRTASTRKGEAARALACPQSEQTQTEETFDAGRGTEQEHADGVYGANNRRAANQ